MLMIKGKLYKIQSKVPELDIRNQMLANKPPVYGIFLEESNFWSEDDPTNKDKIIIDEFKTFTFIVGKHVKEYLTILHSFELIDD